MKMWLAYLRIMSISIVFILNKETCLQTLELNQAIRIIST